MTESSEAPTYEPIDYAERRRTRATERASASHSRIPVLAIVAIAGVLLLGVVFEAAATVGRVHPGVRVSGVDVGGMIPEKARATLETELPKKAASPVTVGYSGKSWGITARDIGLTFDYDSLVDEAMSVGRDGGPIAFVGGRLDAWAGGMDVAASPVADAARMEVAVAKVAAGTDVDPVDATVRIDGTNATVVPAENGLALERDVAASGILEAMLSTDRRVQAPVSTAAAAVSDDEAEEARAIAEQIMSAPVTVTFESKSWTFSPNQIAKWVVFRRSDATQTADSGDAQESQLASGEDVTLVTLISAKKTGKTVIPAIGAKVGNPARNARFRTSNGSVEIVPSKNGVGPDMDALATSMTDELASAISKRRVALRTTLSKPKVSTQDAREMGIKERISTYTTTYEAGNLPRVNNIHLLGGALDGTLVAPGKTFSFNGAVGQRTADKGYKEANAIVNGKLVPQLGGGICQVGTTIFNTIFESGLPIIERRNHSFYISHYPTGRDATISWGGPDFKFKNTTDDWVLISVSYTSSTITISLYGTDPGYDVDSKAGSWRNIKPFPIEEIKDPAMEKGTRVVEDVGVDGRTITVTRTVAKDGEVVYTDSFVSVYKPKIETVRVGTKKPAAKASNQ